MERYRLSALMKDIERGGDIDVVIAADAQRAFDAERANRLAMEACVDRDVKAIKDLKAQLATLQAQLRQVEGERAKWEDIAGLRFAGDHKFVKEMELLKIDLATLRQLVEALPVVDGRMDVECGACYYIRSFVAEQYGVVCGLITEQATAMAIKALLEYRAVLAAQDAGAKLPAWVNEAMRLAPTQTNPPHPTEEQS